MNQRAFLHDDDLVLFCGADPREIHAVIVRLYEAAKAVAAARGPERIDADGEVHARKYRLTFAEVREDKTLRQLKFYFGPVLKQISEQAKGGWLPDAWHEAMKRVHLGYEVVRTQVAGRARPTVYRRLRSVSDLSVKQMSDYIDKVIASAATEEGVVFDLDPREREYVRYRRTTRKPKTEPVAEPA